jgi:predicted enzyme related to lactoylglutathione lyase
MVHYNYTVSDMEKSQTFYKEQFGFKIDRTKKDPNGEY